MYCTNCGGLMNDNQDLCLSCGVNKGIGKKFCANCGEQLNEGAAVCLKCGVAIKKQSSSSFMEGELGGQSKLVMALLCWFLGGLGVHNFMMGETKKGIIKILGTLCFGIPGAILVIYDFVKILTDKYEIDPDKFI